MLASTRTTKFRVIQRLIIAVGTCLVVPACTASVALAAAVAPAPRAEVAPAPAPAAVVPAAVVPAAVAPAPTVAAAAAPAAVAPAPTVAAAAAAAPAAVAPAATASCASGSTSTPFAQFGDSADYSLVSGGSFESGAPGWSLTSSAIVAGNESYEVDGGIHSLAIQPNGVAVSPAICVTTADPTFRFFARRTSGSWGALNVTLRWSDSSGFTHNTTAASLQSGTSWTPTPILKLADALPLWQAGRVLSVKLVFSPEQFGGAWAIDDVYIDPRMS